MKEYGTQAFFETGTFRGDGVAYALQYPFQQVVSVEIVPQIAEAARVRFAASGTVKIIEADSIRALETELSDIASPCLFWLDAHFPGADAGLTSYDAESVEEVRLPLARELETIYQRRKGFSDVFILDDLRIYEDGPYENGNVPADALPKINRNIDFVYRYFGRTHVVLRSFLDEGYILLFPKKQYRKTHFKFMNLFKPRMEKDFYLTKA